MGTFVATFFQSEIVVLLAASLIKIGEELRETLLLLGRTKAAVKPLKRPGGSVNVRPEVVDHAVQTGSLIGIVIETGDDISTQSAIELADSGENFVGGLHLLSAALGDFLRVNDLRHLPKSEARTDSQETDNDNESGREFLSDCQTHRGTLLAIHFRNKSVFGSRSVHCTAAIA